MELARWFSELGLVFDIVGVIISFKHGLPSKVHITLRKDLPGFVQRMNHIFMKRNR